MRFPGPTVACSDRRRTSIAASRSPHGTTVVAIRYAGGVVMAGDRRATAGYTIASRRIEKVFPADELSGVAIAGAAGPGGRDGPALPDRSSSTTRRSRASRSRSRARPTSSRRWSGPTCPPRCRASWSCRSSPATTTAASAGRRLQLRRHRRQVRGSRLPGQRLRRRPRPQLDQGRLARGHEPPTRPSTSRSGRCSRPPTRTSPPAGPTSCGGIFPTVAVIDADGFAALDDDDVEARPTARRSAGGTRPGGRRS